jgi:ankyrin repeat protein
MDWNTALATIKNPNYDDVDTIASLLEKGVSDEALRAMDDDGYTLLMHAAILSKDQTGLYLLNQNPSSIVHLESIREIYGEFISNVYFS